MRRALIVPAVLTIASAHAFADWTNSGGNAMRNGQTDALGPDAPDTLWTGGPSSIIAWQPVIEGDRVFIVRQTGFPPGGEPNGSTIYALDLHTGAELWDQDIPYQNGDWTTWIAGVVNGRLFAARSGNGATVDDVLYALDAATGAILWESDATINAGAYDGVVFAPDGDPVVADFDKVIRINWTDGSTQWSTPRNCSVSSSCGAAIGPDKGHPGLQNFYVAEPAPGGHVLARYDLSSGVRFYESPLMPGFTLQNTPMVGPDGTIYLSRTQNNPAVDFFYAWEDTGGGFVEKWSVSAGWTTASEFAVGHDGSVYMVREDLAVHRLDPETGATIDTSPSIDADFLSPRMAIDGAGRVFVSNGSFADGRLYSFDADLTPRWDVSVTNANIGGPAIASDGTMIVAGVGGDLRAYAGGTPLACPADVNGDGTVDVADLVAVLLGWGACRGCPEDVTGDGFVDVQDLVQVINDWGDCG